MQSKQIKSVVVKSMFQFWQKIRTVKDTSTYSEPVRKHDFGFVLKIHLAEKILVQNDFMLFGR